MANDFSNRTLEERIYECADEFERNAYAFDEVMHAATRTLWERIWSRSLHRELMAESRERVERSRLLLYLTRQLLRSNQGEASRVQLGLVFGRHKDRSS